MGTTTSMSRSDLTVVENLAVSLIYRALGESRYNRTLPEYEAIAARMPHLKQLHFLVNEELEKFLASQGDHQPEFCRFKAGDRRIVFEKYPLQISRETIRKALIVHGLRDPRRARRLTH